MRRYLARSLIPLLLVAQLAACSAHQRFVVVGATVQAVDAAMNIWADYVVAQAKAAGIAPEAWAPEKQALVRKAHDVYRDVAETARVTLVTMNRAPTPADLSSAAAAVVDIVQQLTGKKVVVTP